MLTLQKIEEARKNIALSAHKTALLSSNTFSRMFRCQVYLKTENLQRTGSFKIRGSSNRIAALSQEERLRGVIAASAGNHAQGVALAARLAGIKATIVMPKGASLAKLEATRGYGAEVILWGESYEEAFSHAVLLSQREGLTLIHAYDDEEVIAGQGTIGVEILESLPDVDTVVVPAGGGGLLAGVALGLKSLRPQVEVIGVQSTAAPALARSFASGRRRLVRCSPTVADGIAVGTPGRLAFPIIRRYVDEIVAVDDENITQAMVLLLERCKLVVEGAGAAPLAALLADKLKPDGKKVVLLLSGGNIDINVIARIIDHGLVHAGRYMALRVTLLDRPGQLARLLGCLAQAGANVLEVTHHRRGLHLPLGEVQVEVTLETKNARHASEIIEQLRKAGYVQETSAPEIGQIPAVHHFTYVP